MAEHEKLIARAFEDLAQCLRRLLEAHFDSNRLLQIDRAEAIGNIEAAFGSVLHAFHSLYDAIGKQLDSHPIDWYATPQLATILAIRNARHHNHANRVRTLYQYHVHEVEDPGRMSSYVLIDFPSPEEGADTWGVYISWSDLDSLLSLDESESRIRNETSRAIREYLDSARFPEYTRFYELPEDSLFVNVTPLLVNAGASIVPHIQEYLQPSSVEARLFAGHFADVQPAITSKHEVVCGPIALPG